MQNWSKKRVLIIGSARQGQALARYLVEEGASVTINDQLSADNLKPIMASFKELPIRWVTGGHPLDLLDEADLVCVSGGVPLSIPIVAEAIRRGIPLSNDTQIFLEVAPVEVIGITGSAGKTTTTSLVGKIAAHGLSAPHKSWVGGNIGQPLLSSVKEMKPGDVVIMEVSSFQLEQTRISPHIAVVLNITPNHLDRHGSMEAYTAAKVRILAFQNKADIAILNREDKGSWALRQFVQGRLITFGETRPEAALEGTFVEFGKIFYQYPDRIEEIIPVSAIRLRGRHNLLNVLAACVIAKAAGLSNEAILAGVKDFGGVPHRMELVRELHGVCWYNDSIATTPERSMAAIRAFSEPIILLAGGRDKNLPWDQFAKLVQQRVRCLVTFGEAGGLIQQAVNSVGDRGHPETIVKCSDLEQAVQAAAKLARAGDVVLLSPGGTSFDEFKDFEERGEEYRKWVQQLL